jgi:phage terminase large subunit GpA-like protein
MGDLAIALPEMNVTAAGTSGKGWCDGLTPDPNLTVDQWADEFRMLPKASSSESGHWRTDRVPFVREIMQCLSPSHPCREVAFMKGSQISGTETGLNWLFTLIDLFPGPILAVQPTVDMAKKFVRQRFNPSAAMTPRLAAKLTENKSRESSNTLGQKDFPGGTIMFGGANSAAGLRSMPIQYLFLDEEDNYPDDCDGEGDPVELAKKRTTNFPRRKIFYNSTPNIKATSRVYQHYLAGDQRRCLVPCPDCGGYQLIEWARIDFKKRGTKKRPVLICEHCDAAIEERSKTAMLEHGEWRKQNPDGEYPSFHLPALYSPLGWYSWAHAVRDFLRAKGDPELLKVWVNTCLGEPWEDKGDVVEWSWLLNRREVYPAKVPAGALVLTAGIDVQDNRLEIEVVGWGAGFESWNIAYEVFRGDPGRPEVWEQLDEYLLQPWVHESGVTVHIAAACIDSQGHFTGTVQDWCKSRSMRRVWPIKGAAGSGKPLVGPASKNNAARVEQFPLGVDTGKELVYARLQIAEPGPGYCHFPTDRDEEYFRQMTAEKRITKYRHGRPILTWVISRRGSQRNEALDCRNYSQGALRLLNPALDTMQGPLILDYSQPAKRRRKGGTVVRSNYLG